MLTFEIKYKAFEKTFMLRTLNVKSIEVYLKDEEVEWVKNCKGDFIFSEGKIYRENIIR